MIRSIANHISSAELAERIALWLGDRESVRPEEPAHEISRIALSLHSDRGFLEHLERVGAEAARRGMAPGTLASGAIHRLGHAGNAYLERIGPAQQAAMLAPLTALQASVVQALMRGFASAPPVQAPADERVRRLEDTIRALDRINSVINSSLEINEVLRHTVHAAADMLDVPEVTIYLYDESIDRLILSATRALRQDAVGNTTLALGEGITGWAAHAGQPLVVRDAWSDPRFKYVPGIDEEKLRSFLSVPIVLFTVNRLIGVLNVVATEFRDFTEDELRFAELIAGQLAIAVENARLHQQTDTALRRKVEQLTTLQRSARVLTSNLDLRSVLAMIARQAAELIGVEKAAIFRIDETGDRLCIVAAHNLGSKYATLTLKVGEGVVGRAVASRAPVVVADARTDERLSVPRDLLDEEGYRAMFSVPLVVGDHVLGGISLYSMEPRPFTPEQTDLAFTFGTHAAIAMENARLFEEVSHGLETKSLLLRELHHRVKNNLQTVAALLQMQARHSRSDEAVALLNLSAGRIAGMSRVHDLLSQDELGLTTVGAVMAAMGELVRTDLAASGRRIELQIDDAPVRIGSEKASVFALVVNELLWNALTHGLDGRADGTIQLRASVEDTGVTVRVIDDGRGLPPGFALDRDMGLGLSIVRNLVARNLDGAIRIAPGPDGRGACAALTFKP
ncbi:MAG: GAF domain-containing protein [Actinobacteria bacterium]|nr:GAF domain-containing protein [Actinomycetota bacterium]